MAQALINNFLYFLLATSILFLIGRGILILINKNFSSFSFYTIAYSLFSGIFFVGIIVSIWRTEARTINLVLLLFFVLLLYQFRHKEVNTTSINANDFLFIILSFCFLYIIFFIQHYGSSVINVFPHKDDTNFYSEVSQYIFLTGEENFYNSQNIVSDNFHGTAPYHYFDLWLNAAISNSFSILNINSLVFVLYPLLSFLFFLSFCNILQPYFKGWALYVITISVLFFSGSVFSFLLGESFAVSVSSFCTSVFNKPKLLIIYVVLGFFLLEIQNRDYRKAFLFLLILPIVYVTTFPAIIGAICFLIVFNSKLHLLKKPEYRFILISTILFFILFTGFYYLTGNTKIKSISLFFFPEFENAFEWKLSIRRLFSFAKTVFAIMIIYFPLLLLALNFIIKRRSLLAYVSNISLSNSTKVLIWIFSLSAFLGMFIWSFTYYAPDSQQLLQNIFNPFLAVLLSYFLLRNWNNILCKISYMTIVSLSILYFTAGLNLDFNKNKEVAVSEQFLINVKKYLNENKQISYTGAGVANPAEFKSIFDKNVLVNRQGYYLKYISDNISVVSVNDPFIPISDSTSNFSEGGYFAGKIEKKLISNGIYYNYYNINKKKGFDDNRILINFLKGYNIDFLILSKSANEIHGISPLVKKSYIDPVSGDKLLFLNSSLNKTETFKENHSANVIIKNYLSIYLIVLVVVFLIGFSLLSFIPAFLAFSSLEILLFSFLSGVFFIVVFTSFYFTGFKTINIIVIPILFLIIRQLNKGKESKLVHSSFSVANIMVILFFSIVFFFFSFLRNTKEGEFNFYPIQSDNNFYSEVSGYLIRTGQENIYNAHNLISKDYWGTTAYHYFDEWFNGAISYVFHLNNLKTYLLVTLPFLYFIFFIALLCLIKREKENIWFACIKVFFLMFLSGIILNVFEGTLIDSAIRLYFNNIFTRQKLAIVFILIAVSLVFIKKEKFTTSVLVLFLIPVLYITTFPALYGGIFLLLISNNFHKMFPLQERKYLFIILFGLIAFFLFFYTLTGSSVNVANKIFLFDSEFNDLRFILKRALAFLHPLFFSFLAYLPFLLLLLYLGEHSNLKLYLSNSWKFVFLIFISTFMAGCAAWFLSYYTPDSFQMSHNLSNPFLFLVFVLLINSLFLKQGIVKKIIAGGFLSLLLFLNILETFYSVPLSFEKIPKYIDKLVAGDWKGSAGVIPSDKYLCDLEEFFSSHPSINKIGVSITDSSEYVGIDAKSALVNRSGYYLRYLDDKFSTISISDFSIPIDTESEFQIGRMSFEKEILLSMRETYCFYRFVQKEKRKGFLKSIKDYQLEFIKKYNINFVILSPQSSFPEWIKPYVKTIIADAITGERFVYIET